MSEDKKEGHKVLNGLELQKLGVIGLLVFFINFLMDNMRNDTADLEDKMESLTLAVAEVSTQTRLTNITVEANTTRLEDIAKSTTERYRSSDADKDRGILQRQIDANKTDISDAVGEIVQIKERLYILENKP